ncbi:hypothetical protein [Plantactinospora soyae]|uniref:Uncharacterized protein n=1 Tax=Plantactinospora soyae TaxID=1544732 RepID=A0A927MDY6_9ACTN|nr:hypothetical protein [Plantactinospora soyae]MBE1491361.1 hypothetical protein [Plantactinospora soyae]
MADPRVGELGGAPSLAPVILYASAAGGVTATAVFVTGLHLTDRDWGSSGLPLVISYAVALCAMLVIAVLSTVARWRFGLGRGGSAGHWVHVFVPIFLTVLVPLAVAFGGPVRDRWETSAWWAVAALCVHLGLALGAARQLSGPVRVGAVLGVVALLVAVVGVERISQFRWRVNDFRALDVPLVVPEIPGFDVTHAYPGRPGVRQLFLLLAERPDRPYEGRHVYVTVGRSQPANLPYPGLCWNRGEDRFMSDDTHVTLCLAEDRFELTMSPGPSDWSLEPLLRQITYRPVSARQLARLPGTDSGDTGPWAPD